ncbi:ABC transporter substrate-binding protein [Cytobacillus purgationiresistens]|uniref:Iron complex transport system substrate-binding protein n=1 Tax=Cytobacillus purgationiresistens TaxID=863449 RepID=A0ABU0AS34_9BACI|nr:ABC transporter substrate-binding protein [Cytobacillus purgationiresistens]MDQ0273243.1 iron complex transport system substrate-binding protein [Cytobacillus purgationiresistens]
MKKLYRLFIVLLLAGAVLAGCGNEAQETEDNKQEGNQQEQSAFPTTITDAQDREIVIENKPEKIVSLIPSNTEIAFELGLGDEIVGVSDFDNYPDEANDKEKIGGQEFNVEKIISLSPDLVLAHNSSAHNGEAGLQQLRDSGITVLVVNDAASFDEVFESITMIGTAAGEKEKAEELIKQLKDRLVEVEEKAKSILPEDRKTVFVEISPAPEIYAVGQETFLNNMLQLIQADNVVTEEGWPKLDEESVIERNPEVIITTYGYYTENAEGQVLNRNGWQDVTAIKNEQVIDVHSDKVTRTGPRLIEGVEELAKAIYPEVFK